MLASGITTLGKTVLLVVAITFILWSLYTAMVVPKKHPGFPKRLDLFIVLSALLFAAQIGAVLWVTGTQEVESHEEASGGHDTTGETTEGGGASTTETETTESDGAAAGDAAAGAEIFASAGCGSCHTLADAGASGEVGPNLDELGPTEAQVVAVLNEGKGAMPSFSETLDEQQIADVAAYVSSAAGA